MPCKWCGNYHGFKCPVVKAIEYHPDGSVKRVEFLSIQEIVGAPLMPNQPIWLKTGPADPNVTTC